MKPRNTQPVLELWRIGLWLASYVPVERESDRFDSHRSVAGALQCGANANSPTEWPGCRCLETGSAVLQLMLKSALVAAVTLAAEAVKR